MRRVIQNSQDNDVHTRTGFTRLYQVLKERRLSRVFTMGALDFGLDLGFIICELRAQGFRDYGMV